MLKSLQDLLDSGKISQEEAKSILKEIEAIEQEIANLKREKEELSKTLSELKDSKEKLQKQVESLDERIKKAKEEGKRELVKELEAERAEKEALKRSLEDIEAKNKTLTAKSALQSALSKFEVIDAEIVSEVLMPKITVGEDGIKYIDGNNQFDVEEGLKRFFENKPHLLKAKGNPGSGAGGAGSKEQKSWEEMSATERLELYKSNPEKYRELKGDR